MVTYGMTEERIGQECHTTIYLGTTTVAELRMVQGNVSSRLYEHQTEREAYCRPWSPAARSRMRVMLRRPSRRALSGFFVGLRDVHVVYALKGWAWFRSAPGPVVRQKIIQLERCSCLRYSAARQSILAQRLFS
jgi:hypothetical protein